MSKNISFEEQYKIFQDLEFKLNEGVTIQDIKRWENDSFLKEPFSLLYVTFLSFTLTSQIIWILISIYILYLYVVFLSSNEYMIIKSYRKNQ